VVNREGPLSGENEDTEFIAATFPLWYLLRGSVGMSANGGLENSEDASDLDWQLSLDYKKSKPQLNGKYGNCDLSMSRSY
jgi:hypothetical protein